MTTCANTIEILKKRIDISHCPSHERYVQQVCMFNPRAAVEPTHTPLKAIKIYSFFS
jgi:hypothetical protein